MKETEIVEKIINIIEKEDKRNPLTDEEISEKLKTSREIITKIRIEQKILNSRERNTDRLKKDIGIILKEEGKISNRKLTKKLNEIGYNIGKYAVDRVYSEIISDYTEMSEKEIKSDKITHDYKEMAENERKDFKKIIKPAKNEENIFEKFIGYDKSLKNSIDKLKAAVMYPPKGLHTIIYGESGVGKSYLAELTHSYAITTDNFSDNAPYFEFNCADYADNPQLLISQLFGYSKGAFTGADEDKKGIVELCNGGILFLDEIHRLPSEGQEILFSLMDKGRYRRLGEVNTDRKSKIMIIAATTEAPDSALLLTFRRRIPMSIKIPPLNERTPEEKLELIKYFLYEESLRLKKKIRIKKEVIENFLEVVYPGNIGQLKSEIQVSCAKAFLESKIENKEEIEIKKEFFIDVSRRRLNLKIKNLLENEYIILPNKNNKRISNKNISQIGNSNIYQKIEKKYDELKEKGIEIKKINILLEEEVKKEFLENIMKFNKKEFNYKELQQIVGEEVLESVVKAYELAKISFPDLNSQIVFPLSVHIKTSIDRIKEGKQINVSVSENFKISNEAEMKIAEKMLKIINEKCYLNFPLSEIGLIAMYLKEFRKNSKYNEKIGLIVLSHGKVATGMADVANRVLNEEYAIGLEMDFSDTPQYMFEKTVNLVRQIDRGKGCIILADMGSLLNFEEKIKERTGINVKIIGRVDTLMVIECMRKVLYTSDNIEEIAAEIDEKNTRTEKNNGLKKKKIILCLCITGQGAAQNLKNHLSERLKSVLDEVEIITKGYIEGENTEEIIKQLNRKYEILAVIGTFETDEKINNLDFISIEEAYQLKGIKKIREILKRKIAFNKNNLDEILNTDFIRLSDLKYKEEILDAMIGKMKEKGMVKDEFLLSVYKRESSVATYLNGGIAIPHGESRFVNEPCIFITKLDKPVIWDGANMADIVFLLALNENSKKYFEQLYKIISDENTVNTIRNAKTKEEILKILCKNTEPVN